MTLTLTEMARELRIENVQYEYFSGVIDFETAMQILAGPLSPDKEDTIDDREQLRLKTEDLFRAATSHLRAYKEELYEDILVIEAKRSLLISPAPGEDYPTLLMLRKQMITAIEHEIHSKKRSSRGI